MSETRQHHPELHRPEELVAKIRCWGRELGFQRVGIAGIELEEDGRRLQRWLSRGRHGEMAYMIKHGTKRSRPGELIPGTVSVISARMNYLTDTVAEAEKILQDPCTAYISRYALGRDYHKLMRARLQKLAQKISADIGAFGYRVFSDSAPVLERGLAREAGLGWIGKHGNLISRNDGSWFFLSEIYTDLPLPPDRAFDGNHCGSCTACLDICPTQAIVAPYEVDARRCISYLTIEYRGAIPVEYRPLIGNRIFGCDDCQIVCPWNRFAKISSETDFAPRSGLDSSALLDLFAWTEAEFRKRTEGSAIRRITYRQWQRNLAISLGNAPASTTVRNTLGKASVAATPLVAEHIQWALRRQSEKLETHEET
ncbi:MAG: tRNA epoxyqueuosine(34) reductase QueG [Gammaproteobacteria bacterium]|nr:tRNA epoxyqueuosine(34) reductase QueG [Gammaproteobacteria bacterium]